ncbi:hypothetical protein [Virgibacillus alimentarius]|uniref:hypothetical protein n=1 Tax=Virgibacillus alimentarius TaxID=698769 RepID=UPI0004938C6B|nr:hypothetical protein [Virgibacillus alimentarius]
MKKNIIIGLLLLVIVGCSNEEISTASTEEENSLDWEISNEVEKTDSANLGEELLLKDLRINDSSAKVIEALGKPISQDELRKVESSNFKEIVYEQQYFLIKDDKVVGYAIKAPGLKTKSGIAINDTLNKLVNAYADRKVLKTDSTYYMYDENFILSFVVDDNVINQIGLFDLESYLNMSDWTIDDLLLQSEPIINERKRDKDNNELVDISEVINYFENVGYHIQVKNRMISDTIGAIYAYNVVVNNSEHEVEFYGFDPKNEDTITKESIEEAKKTGILNPHGVGIPVIFNGNIAIFIDEEHPDKNQIEKDFIEFNSLSN